MQKEWTLVLQRLITITVLLIFSACGMPSVSDLVVVAGPRGWRFITSDCASNTTSKKEWFFYKHSDQVVHIKKILSILTSFNLMLHLKDFL